MHKKTSQGIGIRCARCGGTFPLQTLATAVLCPYCGARQELTENASEAQRYRDAVFGAMRAADADRQQAASMAQWSGVSARWSKIVYVVIVAQMLLSTCAAVPALVLHSSGEWSAEWLQAAMSTGMTVCTVLAFVAILAGVLWTQRARIASSLGRTAPPPAKKIACPHCGAPNYLSAGQAVHSCGHCRGALIPSKTAMIQALDAVRRERRRAAMELHRQSRTMMLATQQGATMRHLFPLLMIGGSVAMPLVTLPLMVVLEPDVELRTKAIVGGVGVALIAIVTSIIAALVARRRQRKRALREALSDLEMQFHGHVTSKLHGFIAWLNAYWAGTYELRRLAVSPMFGFVSLDAWGYAAGIAVSLTQPVVGRCATFVDILLAAWVPSVSEGRPEPPISAQAAATLAWLRASGFEVQRTEAGLLASATPAVVAQLWREPSGVHHLATITAHLVRLAHEIGAQPVTHVE